MKLTTVVLHRKGRALYLQGMTHHAPAPFYEKIQTEMESGVRAGGRVFYERADGFGRHEELCTTDAQRAIIAFLALQKRLSSEWSKTEELAPQCTGLHYPENSVNADMTFPEIIRALARRNFHRSAYFRRIGQVLKDDTMKEALHRQISELMARDNASAVIGSVCDNMPKCLRNVVIHLRNQRIVETVIRKICDEAIRLGLLFYGEAHMSGLIDLFQSAGWHVGVQIELTHQEVIGRELSFEGFH